MSNDPKGAPKAGKSFNDKNTARRAQGEDTLSRASDLVKGLMRNDQSPLAAGFTRLKLGVQWPDVVGDRIAKMTAPAAFDDGVLEIWVAHPTWMQELWFIKDELREKVNRALGGSSCREVRFTLNRRQSSESPIKR